MITISSGCNEGRKLTKHPVNENAQSKQEGSLRPSRSATERGVEYLFQQLDDDPLWHSPNYGNLRAGGAITCLVLYAMGHLDYDFDQRQLQQMRQAAEALQAGIEEHGYVTNPDGPDYSNYASAMLLSADQTLGLELPRHIRQKLVDYLVRAQLTEEEGFEDNDVNFGGWDLTGWMRGRRPTTGTNISVTSFVMESLASVSPAAEIDECLDHGRKWLARCEAAEGGFYFHPRRDHDGNKAGWLDESRAEPRPYGTATADGIRCLAALGNRASQEALKKHLGWFDDRHNLSRVPGFEHETESGTWAIGLKYYYWFAVSEILDEFPAERRHDLALQIRELVSSAQQDEGSWSNENARMREDDPIIATCFALIALANAERVLKE